MDYEAVLFDVDGVLLTRHDSHPDVYYEAIGRILRSFDVEPDEEEIASFFGGATLPEMQRICRRYDVEFEQFWTTRERDMAALQREMMECGERTLYDDCTVLSTLAEDRIVGLVSNNQHETISHMVEVFEMADHVETFYGRDPTVDGYRYMKPESHYIERALEDVGTRDALYVGDSNGDIVAAHEAGLDSAFIRRPHRRDYETSPTPTYEIETLDELASMLTERGA